MEREQNHHAKLKELLRNLTSTEVQLCSDASKQFVKILNSHTGPEFVRVYIGSSSKLVEISEAWEIHKGKPGFVHILDLLSTILKNCNEDVGFEGGVNACRSLDKFARAVIEEKMGDLYKELNSKEGRRQNAVLLFLASIVRRNPQLAWEVTKVFDFKLTCFPKLAEVRLRAKESVDVRRKSYSTRKAFVGFSMAFLEVGHPRLLRGVLQQKEMYSGVLRGLGNDDEETVVYILSVLRDRVLVPESLVPPGLRSVLFGSVTLEQLVIVSGKEDFSDAAELAYNVLVMVCTDPVNGLMPDLERQPTPLRGNLKRLLDLMKKLKATEVNYHKDLLRAIVKGRPSFGSAYLDEFPYNLEDISSANWFAAISLAADVVSSVSEGLSLFADKPTGFDDPVVQNIVKCIGPRPFTRLVINKGLLHSDTLVKHGTLRLVLEALNLLDVLLSSVDHSSISNRKKLKEEIQDGVRTSLPDPQVLLSLLSPLPSHFKSFESATKRKAETEDSSINDGNATKRRKRCIENEDMDIVVVGVRSFSEVDLSKDGIAENGSDPVKDIGDIWGLRQCSMLHANIKDGDSFFYSKILDTIAIYYRTMPMVLEGLFDLFKLIPSNPLSAPTILLQSLLNLLVEHVNQIRTHPQIYKHLQPFLALLLYSPAREIKEQAYILAKEAMLSTGTFENNPSDICTWFLFIPGYNGFHAYVEDLEVEIFQQLSSVVVSFLCDAVTTTGNNLYKYMELLMHYINDAELGKDLSPEVSPFIICVLEKCFRLLSSESGSFTLPQKSLISLYICNTIKYLLDTQVNAEPLSFLLHCVLTEKFGSADLLDLVICPCEWRPLKALLVFARKLLNRKPYGIYSYLGGLTGGSNSFVDTISDIKKVLRDDYNNIGLVGLAVGFSFSLMCTHHTDILENIPSILSISNTLLKVPLSVLASMFFLESTYLSHVSRLWPEMVISGLGNVDHVTDKNEEAFDFGSEETASVAFASFLKGAPFCVLFSFAVHNSNLRFFEQPAVQKLILDKLTDLPPDYLVNSLRNVLFWMYRVRSWGGVGSLDELEMASKLCSALAEHLLKQLLVQNVDTVKLPHYAVEVAEIILNHPAVTVSLESPFYVDKGFTDSVFKENTETLLESVKRGVHAMDHHILSMLKTISELLLPICNGQSSDQASNGCKRISKAFKALVQKLVLIFKSTFDGCVKSGDFKPLVPKFHALHTLIHFIPPFELLELVTWLFSHIDLLQSKGNALFVCLHLASCSFDILSVYCVLDGTDETRSDASSLFGRIYFQVLEIAYRLRLDMADLALLKAVKVVRLRKVGQNPQLPFVMVLSRVIASAHVNTVSHCLNRVNKTKAELLYRIAEISPLHLSAFGFMFYETLNKSFLPNPNLMQEASFSDEELVMLLPTVFLYLKLKISKFGGQISEPFKCINSVYGRILLGGFGNWNIFVSGNISEIGIDETLPTSIEKNSDFFSDSLLGKAILMVRDYLASNEHLMNLEKRLSLCSSLCPNDSARDDIFGHKIGEVGNYSHNQALEFVNRVVAKINFCRMLLFLDPNQEIKSEMENLRVRFLTVLINSWRSIVKKFPENIEDKNLLPFRFLETFTMRNIYDLTMKMHDSIVKLSSISFIEQLVKSFLRYRFNDHITLKMIRTVLASLSDENFSCASIIQLVLGHSQFAKSIQMASKSIGSTLGLIFTPVPSILRSLAIPHINLNTQDCEISTLTSQQHLLELVKLVRVLFHIYTQHTNVDFGEDTVIKSEELVYLLLSSYGATCSEIDMEIYGLIQERELNDNSCAGAVARVDYQWGIASLKAIKDLEKDKGVNSVDCKMIEATEENRRIQFRENLLVDPKLCAQTVLYFPYSRFVNGGTFEVHQKDNSTFMHKVGCTMLDKLQIYDPVFILRFSIHSLSMGYIEPIEFASLGLLAIAFVSISSPDDDMRKLGYEVLAKFKSALETCRKKKEVKRLLLLLSYLQNGVQEPWQWIPSVITVFLAEASLVLLNPSNENYSTISMHLMNSPSVNLKTVPLFQKLFWSTSVNFRADRLWMLRLLHVGLNTEDDAQIYLKSSVFDTLISFYSSPLSDNDSKELIIQIVKKAVQFHKTIRFLVERCGLILWLSSVVSSLCASESQDGKRFALKVLPSILEVVKCITSSGNIVEWLQEHALEQLAEFSSHLYKLTVGGIELVKEQTYICNSILQILILVLKMSQEREICQPYFALSFEGLYNLYEAVEAFSKTKCNATMVLRLEAILISSPPVSILQMDKEKLSKFLSWAVTTAIWSKSTKALQPEDTDYSLIAVTEEKPPVNSLVSKLLRWLTASVILGKFSYKLSKIKSGNFTETKSPRSWEALLECHEKGFGEDLGYGGEDILALSTFYLLQLTGFSHTLLPSVVPALCLLHRSSLESLDHLASSFSSLCSKIQSPPEANPAWRWSFNEPWRDVSSEELKGREKLEEVHACEKLMVMASNIVSKKALVGSQPISITLEDVVDDLGVYDWERSLLQSERL